MAYVSNDGVFENEDIDIDDPTKIDTWDAIVDSLVQWIDGNDLIFQEMKRLSRSRIAQNYGAIQNSTEYFETLRNNMEQSDMIEFLIHLFTCMSFHINLGEIHVGQMIRMYRQKLEECHKHHQLQGIYNDINFVGRQKDIDYIISTFSKSRPEVKGISICGLGGMGKTSLAREVCFKMKFTKARWRPIKIDLREKSSLLDLLRDTLTKLGEMCSSDSVMDLQQQLLDLIKNKLYRKKYILLFDNVDDVMMEDRYGILNFFNEALQILDELGDTCMIRILITTRVTLMTEEEIRMRSQLRRKDSRLEGLVQEIEIKPLQEKDAVLLLQRCTKNLQIPIDDSKCTEIVQLCGYCPLAIRSVSGTLKCGLISPENMAYNLKSGERGTSMTEILNVCHCLRQTFDTLDKTFQRKLIQLSVFNTASFNISAAASVLGEPSLSPEMPIGMNTKLDLLYLKSRHMIEIEDLSLENEDDVILPIRNSRNIEYSLHPLVHMFLRDTIKQKGDELQNDLRTAKLRFVTHFRLLINEIGKTQEKNCLKSQNIVAENRTHVINFYDMVLEFRSRDVQDSSEDTKLDVILCNKRIADLADLVLISQKKWVLLDKWMSESAQEGDLITNMFWKVLAASKLLDMDRNNEVENYIGEIKEILNSKMEITDSLKVVLGLYYLLKGRYYIRAMLADEALRDLEQAMLIFQQKSIKKNYKTTLAKVFNCMGCAYYRQRPPDLRKAEEFHRKALETVSSKADDYKNLDIPMYLTNIGTCCYKEGQSIFERNPGAAKKRFEEALNYYSRAIQLDVQMNAHKFDGFAQKLRNRADVYVMLKEFDPAVKDIMESLNIRRRTLTPPHVQLTITAFKVAEILRRQATHLYFEDKKDEGLKILDESIKYFSVTAHLIKTGGIRSDHEEYENIKNMHLKALKYSQNQQKRKHYEKFYRDFESGKYDRKSQRERNLRNTMKVLPTIEDQMAMAGQQTICSTSSSSTSSSSSSSESDSESVSGESDVVIDKYKYFIDSDDESKQKETDTTSKTESMELESSVCTKEPMSSESGSSSSGTSSVTENLKGLTALESGGKRPSLLSMDSSSFEDDVFGKRTYKSSVCKQGSRDSSMSVFLKKAVERRRSTLKSVESSSFEDSFYAGNQISPMDYITQLKAKQRHKEEKRRKLLQMHEAMSLEEHSDNTDTVEKSDIGDTETVSESGNPSDLESNKRSENMESTDYSSTKILKTMETADHSPTKILKTIETADHSPTKILKSMETADHSPNKI